MSSSLVGILLGMVVGLRHAFEPDHLTAVATLATEAKDARKGAMLGALWGLGHTLSLVGVGIALILIGVVLPERLAATFELGVCVMLVVLGARSLWVASRLGPRGPIHAHEHGEHLHTHAGAQPHVHVGARTLALRPLVVGLVHGLAGSGAVTALVFAELPSNVTRIVYIALFGLGSVAGMAIASGLVGMSFRSLDRSRRWLSYGAGAFSIIAGIVWSIPLVSLVAA